MTINKPLPLPPHKKTHFNKAEWKEGHIVGTEEWIEEHFLNTTVEVSLQLLHLRADEFWGVWAGVSRYRGRAAELFPQVLPQKGHKFSWPDKRCPLSSFPFREAAVVWSCRYASTSTAFLVEAAQWNVHPKPANKPTTKLDYSQFILFTDNRFISANYLLVLIIFTLF